MKLQRILPFARTLLQSAASEGDVVVDATMGNGHDTLFLAQIVGESGTVIAFDVQEDAITATSRRLKDANITSNVYLYQESHAQAKTRLADYKEQVAAAIFNLGYLPGSDKSITTQADSTIAAIKGIFENLKVEGIIVLVIYHGHEEGKIEKEAVMDWIATIPQDEAHVLQYQFLNQQNNPPYIVAIEKR